MAAKLLGAGDPRVGDEGGFGGADLAAARELHGRVGADRWCVNRHDLKILKAGVAGAIADGRVVPTSRDEFDIGDRTMGPSIYTVIDQHIKPTTLRAGAMSWALMQHPEGLPCDVFITHAWHEGLFEFVDKVLCSFPWRASYAWCCFLALPQHLDIGAMIRSPRESPFAEALRAASHMLVVPNDKVSIYTRLWCCYEAFLAHEEGKVIQTARSPYTVAAMCCEVLGMADAVAAGGVLVLYQDETLYKWVYSMGRVVQLLVIFASMFSFDPDRRRLWNRIGLVVSAYMLGVIIYAITHLAKGVLLVNTQGVLEFPRHMHWRPMLLAAGLMRLIFFLVADIDRVRFMNTRSQAAQLTKGYTGTIEDAQCSSDFDKASIRAEICDRVGAVDETIKVLIRAGMSTPSLQVASKLHVDMDGAGFTEYAFCVLLAGLSVECLFRLWDGVIGHLVSSPMLVGFLLNLALSCAFVFYFLCTPADARAFAFRVLFKIGTWVLAVPLAITQVLYAYGSVGVMLREKVLLVALMAVWITAFPLSVSRIDGVAQMPYIGPKLANWLAVRGSPAIRRRSQAYSVVSDEEITLHSSSSEEGASSDLSSSDNPEEEAQ